MPVILSAMSTPSDATIYEHTLRPQWGRGVAVIIEQDRTKFVFEHGGERTFRRGDPSIRLAVVGEEERPKLLEVLLKMQKKSAAPAKKKKAAKLPKLSTED